MADGEAGGVHLQPDSTNGAIQPHDHELPGLTAGDEVRIGGIGVAGDDDVRAYPISLRVE